MVKKVLLLCSIIFVLLTAILFSFDEFDRFNPFLQKETSYANVKANTQDYQNITIYSANGEKRDYKLSFNGYDPSKQKVKITHKGTYVEHIDYIDKLPFASLK
ncbi:YxeA family protein [Staphylococcus caeli]|uniref:YxeA family protein n=1 Tax=Staphylococcus caeli TaxID=2201815 RepID=UPI003F55281C